jgi:Spy/CpxP family protein refolding chaperone
MKIKNLILILFVAVLLVAAQRFATNIAHAQTPTPTDVAPLLPAGPPPFSKPSISEMLSQVLSLTDAQKSQLQATFEATQTQLDAIHEQARQAEEPVLRQLEAQLRPLLTAEQQARLDQIEAMRAAGPSAPAVSGSGTGTAQ